MDKKEILKIAIKLLILSWLFLLGIFAFASCSASHGVVSSGLLAGNWDIIPHSGFPKMPICFP